MKLLNLGCGYPRIPGEEWTNLDNLREQLPEGSTERDQLDGETNYIEHNLEHAVMPFQRDEFDGILASHVFEHFDAQHGLAVMQDCYRILKPGGVLVVSVPDAAYFRRVYPRDNVRNWPELFGVTDYANPIPTFFQAALWFDQHKAILTEDALWCYFTRAGFNIYPSELKVTLEICLHLNRRQFSVEMAGYKH